MPGASRSRTSVAEPRNTTRSTMAGTRFSPAEPCVSIRTRSGLITACAVIRPERVRIETHGSAGENRVPAMVERVVFLGSATEVLLRLAPGIQVQALMQNDGSRADLAQGTPVNVYLPPDALRVLAGAAGDVPLAEDEHLVAS